MDWTLLKSLAAVNAHGSLSAAARDTGISQPTLSRHLSQLEQSIGARLIDRSVRGISLTPRGAELIAHVTDMAAAADRLALAVAGQAKSLSGTVRITASQIVSTYVLPRLLTDLKIAEPEITVELVASDRSENLLRREADIAVRMYRPTQDDVVARKVGDIGMSMFAAHSYVERRGVPETIEDVLNHDVIGYDRSDLIIQGFKQMGQEVDRDFFAFRSDDQVVCWQMIVAGLGLGFNQTLMAEHEQGVVQLVDLGDQISLPIWLTAHAELRSSPRVRRVYDFLGEALNDHCNRAK